MVLGGYTSRMTSELRDLMAQLELSLVETVSRLEDAETALLLVAVLDLEQHVEALQDALAFVADSVADGSSPIDPPAPVSPPPGSP